jgi:asparagine synthase (glutamine-hydrolysing)
MDGLTQYSRSDGRAVVRALLGIDDRDPLADRNLVEFCLAVPSDQFLRDGVTRRLPRHAMADRLPREVLNNNRLGQQNPEWFARLSVNRSRMMDVLSALQRSPIAGKYLDLPRLSNLLHNWPESPVLDAKSYHYVLPRALHIGQFLLWFEKNRT